MTAKDREKILAAGFIIFRRNYLTLDIRSLTINGGWKIWEKGFKSKAAIDRRMKELLERPEVVED